MYIRTSHPYPYPRIPRVGRSNSSKLLSEPNAAPPAGSRGLLEDTAGSLVGNGGEGEAPPKEGVVDVACEALADQVHWEKAYDARP